MPSLLSGQLPQGRTIPVATTHPDNAFTLLARSHDLRVHELLGLCPESLCPQPERTGILPRGTGGLLLDGAAAFWRIVQPGTSGEDPNGALFGEANAAMKQASGSERRGGSAGPGCSHHRASWTSSTTSPGRATAGRPSTSCTC